MVILQELPLALPALTRSERIPARLLMLYGLIISLTYKSVNRDDRTHDLT